MTRLTFVERAANYSVVMKYSIAAALLALILSAGAVSPTRAEISVHATFSADETRIIVAWFRDHGVESRGRGKGKKAGALPPGIAKNLARGKALPPGIAKQYLPADLIARLPAAPPGYERIIVDGKVLLVEVATRVIHDILSDVILR